MRVIEGDCRAVLAGLEADSLDACVTDPPYHLIAGGIGLRSMMVDGKGNTLTSSARGGFMNAKWDGGDVAFQPDTWRAVYRVLRPGAHLLAFSGTRTSHRMVCAIEDAGFEIRDTMAFLWAYATGFPKSHNLDGEWKGWGTALKPAYEPIVCARKGFTGVPCLDSIAESTMLIEALLWSIAPARFVELCSASNQSDQAQGSVRWIAAALVTAQSVAPYAVTATFSSPEAASTFLSIARLWNAILVAICSKPSTFTTGMASSLTTGLRTLNSWLSGIIPEPIIQAACCQSGLWLNAPDADETSSATSTSYRATRWPSADVNVSCDTTRRILHTLADIAASSSPLSRATIADIVQASALIGRPMEPSASERTASVPDVAQLLRLHCDTLRSIVAGNVWPLPTASPNVTPIVLARKPLGERTVAANVLAHGTGAINVDACRVAADEPIPQFISHGGRKFEQSHSQPDRKTAQVGAHTMGRWPANVVHDGSDEVEAAFAAFGDAPGQQAATRCDDTPKTNAIFGAMRHDPMQHAPRGDTGSASRFFFSAKASAADRAESKHPTIKPTSLLRWLVKLITPPGGTVLDPFAGSGTTAEAAMLEGFDAILIEKDPASVKDIKHRMARWSGGDMPLFAPVPAPPEDARIADLFREPESVATLGD